MEGSKDRARTILVSLAIIGVVASLAAFFAHRAAEGTPADSVDAAAPPR